MLAIALVLGAALVGASVVMAVYRLLGSVEASESSSELRSTANVVAAVRDLARLETAEFHMERVIDLRDRQAHMFGMVQAEDAILLVAAADVVAGVDLTEMSDGDIVVEEETRVATVVLPAPRVLLTRLDSQNTFVHTRSTDLLARRNETLETRARQAAEKELEQAAIDAGILDRARHNAAETVTTLLYALGFSKVEVRWRDRE